MNVMRFLAKIRSKIRLLASITLATVFLIFLIQNIEHVQVSFLLWSISIPRALLLLLTLSIGIAIGVLTVLGKRHSMVPRTARDEELIKKHD